MFAKVKLISLSAFAIFVLSSCSGAYQLLKEQDGVAISYKIKQNKKTAQNEVYLKFTNKSDSHQSIDLELGFYNNGILDATSTITNCLKKGPFPQIHSIVDDEIASKINTEGQNNESTSETGEIVRIEITSLTITPIDECRKVNSQ